MDRFEAVGQEAVGQTIGVGNQVRRGCGCFVKRAGSIREDDPRPLPSSNLYQRSFQEQI
jgi:hypothetical protein